MTDSNTVEKTTLLIVEDDEVIVQLLEYTLTAAGYRVLAARNGGECLDLFKQYNLDINLVLMDIMFPRMNGVDLFNALKMYDTNVKCIFVSGSLGKLNLDLLRSRGVMGFVEKPFSVDHLLAKVAQALNNSAPQW